MSRDAPFSLRALRENGELQVMLQQVAGGPVISADRGGLVERSVSRRHTEGEAGGQTLASGVSSCFFLSWLSGQWRGKFFPSGEISLAPLSFEGFPLELGGTTLEM